MNGKKARALRKKFLKEPANLMAIKHFRMITVKKQTPLDSRPVNDALGLEKEGEQKYEQVKVLRLQAIWNGGKRKYKDAKKEMKLCQPKQN